MILNWFKMSFDWTPKLKMDFSRTPTLDQLMRLRDSLDVWVRSIYQTVPVNSLDGDTILKIMGYMCNEFSVRTPDGYIPPVFLRIPDGTMYEDIGYRLIKDQLERESLLPPAEKRMLFDGVMGWLFYNPGTKHDEEMNRILLQYADQFRVDRLSRNFEQIFNRFASLIGNAYQVNKELEKTHKDDRELTYRTLFTQSSHSLYFRVDKIKAIRPNFSPNVKIE